MSKDLVTQLLITATHNNNLDETVKTLLKQAASIITYDQGVITHLKLKERQIEYYQKAEKETRNACSQKINELQGQIAQLKETNRGHQKGLKRAQQKLEREKTRTHELERTLKQQEQKTNKTKIERLRDYFGI